MKRSLVLFLVLCSVSAGAVAQSFDGFKSAFTGFADSMAGSLNINATVGDTWSSAYVGGFPHFGVGLAAGATFVDPTATAAIFSAIGQPMPAEFSSVGLPVPAAAATFKIGLPFIPLDIGLKAGLIPESVGNSLSSLYGVTADYKNVGLSLRYALLKEKLLVPALSIGLSANYVQGFIKKTISGGQTMSFSDGSGNNWVATMSDPTLDLGWVSKSLDLTAQVSKKIVFFTPYAGAGFTVGNSTVTGGLDSSLTVTKNGSASTAEALAAALAQAGQTVDLSGTGFSYTATSTAPTFRVYGGFSLDILLVLDCQVMYVPATKNLGASITTRIQL
jgi:hypothetical protein